MRDLKPLYSVLNNILSLFDRLMVVESSKLDAIAVNDVEKLDMYMRSEQAFTMELRGLDSKRESVQASLGFEGYTLRNIIGAVSGEDSGRLSALFEQLQQKTDELTAAVACTKKFIDLHLQSLDFVLHKMGEEQREPQAAVYNPTGEKKSEDAESPRFTSRKV